MTYPRCSQCEFEITDLRPVSAIYEPNGKIRIYCEACTVVNMLDAAWQKDHAEQSE